MQFSVPELDALRDDARRRPDMRRVHAELLAQRFVEEMEDKALVPRLTELLLPVEA